MSDEMNYTSFDGKDLGTSENNQITESEEKLNNAKTAAEAADTAKDNSFSGGPIMSPKAETTSDKKGKKSGKKNKRGKTTKAKLKWWQVILRIFIICVCIGVILGSIVGVAVSMYLTDVTADDNKILDLDQLKLSFATTLMAYNDETGQWEEYERLYGDENRVWVNYSDMPQSLIKATIASEDQRFLTHHGVDWKRTIFAFLNEYIINLSDSTQGGSTLTQQLIKNLTDEKAVSGIDGVLRKVREIYRALELEKNYSKEQILEAYLNTFRLGGTVAGIEAGANYYCGKSSKELSIAEAAAVVCITKAPTAYSPYINPEDNKIQRDYIIKSMYNQGLITEAEKNEALAESDAMVFDEENIRRATSSTVYSYFTDAAIEQVLEDLQEINGLSEEEAYTLLFEGGLTIYLTVDTDIQSFAEEVAFDESRWPDLELDKEGNPVENQIESAFIMMDYEGHVVAVTGGIREKTASRSFNRATQATRQPGSSFKPVAVYAPAIELKKIHFSSLFPDKASEIIEDNPWPKNFSDTYGNPITIYEAVAQSLNTVAVHTINLIGIDFSFDFLTTSMGYTTLVDKRWSEEQGKYLTDRTKSMSLGGLTDGVSLLEMCAAYAVFGNGGTYYSPMFYTQICDRSGDVILDKTKHITKSVALSEQTAFITNKILQGVFQIGTLTKARFNGLPMAGKSGTASDNNDFWTAGLTPYYVAVTWMGYDQNKYIKPYSLHFDIQYAWRDIMQYACKVLPYKDFPKASGVVQATFCLDSGDLATESCKRTAVGYYTPDNMPGKCNHGYLTLVEETEENATA